MTKSILCYGDSITWGYDPRDGSRFPREARWPGVLEAALQGRARVIEEGLNARTVATDEPSRPNRNGLAMLPPLLESHAPLDVVAIMLGTNDSAPCYGLTSGKIAMNCAALIRTVNASLAGPGGATPRTLLIAPPPLGSLSAEMSLFYAGGEPTSQGLAAAYRTIAQRFDALFLDAGQVTKVSAADGVHLDPDGQRALGLAVAKLLEPLL
ncbi:MAG TPA: SGNH/GDSL hydrolase family protein [Methyloceanibacter sp.]|nr:SGNH/GDSL hydrolase family protein [Methyloceanibacter sp.]